MPDINTLITQYFVKVGDVVQAADNPADSDIAITTAIVPETESGIRATHLIDGINYFGALKGEIAALLAGGTDRFFYTTCWTLGTSPTPDLVPIGEGTFTSAWQANAANFAGGKQIAFQLEDASGGPFHPFQEDIKAMAVAGVDVRFLVWASPFLVNFKKAATAAGNYTLQYWAVNVHSLRSVLDLRQLPNMHNKVVVNTLAHTLGAMHLKMVICGDSTGFRGYVGGIDFTQWRNAKPTHQPITGHSNNWHDVMIKVEGSAANGLYRCFLELWDEQVKRSAKIFKAFGEKIQSHVDDTPLLPDRFTVAISGGTCHTQVLQTLPTMNFTLFGSDRAPMTEGFFQKPLDCIIRIVTSFKQQKLSFAEKGRFEFRAAQRKAVMAAQQYIYIEDQAMENIELARWINKRLQQVSDLKVIMVYGGDPLDPPPPDLPDMMDLLVEGLAAPAERIVFVQAPYIVHAKVTIIDDLWAVIGSSNCWVRSFYLDGEMNIAVLDEADPPFAAKLRKDLWGELCGKEPGPACDPLLPLNDALGIWRDSWGTKPFNLRTDLVKKTVPFVFLPPPPSGQVLPPEVWLGKPPPAPPRPPSPTKTQREQQQGADSRLEY